MLAGSLSKVVYDAFSTEGTAITLAALLVAAIASIVTFPQIYNQAGLNRGPLTFMKWTVAFQNGFFWSVIMGEISLAAR